MAKTLFWGILITLGILKALLVSSGKRTPYVLSNLSIGKRADGFPISATPLLTVGRNFTELKGLTG